MVSPVFDVRSYGAIGDGESLDTQAINEAIQAARQQGGGTVYFPTGTYLSGSIRLESDVTLFLDAGAILRGAPNDIHAYDSPEELGFPAYQDFGHSHWHNSLIWGEDVENVRITGSGTIHGGGMVRGESPEGGGDKAIALKLCRQIVIEGIRIRDAGHFGILATGCDYVRIQSLDINTSRDGINIDACHNVIISDCTINSVRYSRDEEGNLRAEGGDDAIALKTSYALGRKRSCENITINNCCLAGGCNAIQFGSETNGDFRNISIANCAVANSKKAGLGITCNDGGTIDGVVVTNLTMRNVATPIFIKLSNRARGPEGTPVGQIRNVSISHVVATDIYDFIAGRKWTTTIAGLPRQSLSNISLGDIYMEYKGGMPAQPSVDIVSELPENIGYPPRKLGIRPAYGLYCAYVEGLRLENVRVGFEDNDDRPALICHNVNGLSLTGFVCKRGQSRPSPVVLKDVDAVFLGGSPSLPRINARCTGIEAPAGPVPAGTDFSVTAFVASDSEGLAELNLSVDGKNAEVQYVWLEPETPRQVTFSKLSLDLPGTYPLSLGDSVASITITCEEKTGEQYP